VHATCTFIPPLFDEDIKELTQSIGHASQLEVITRLLDHLDELLKQEGWLT
jgi:6-phosphofructokinase